MVRTKEGRGVIDMIQKCCYCQKVYGEKEPFDDTSETHGICAQCLPAVLRGIEKDLKDGKNPIDRL